MQAQWHPQLQWKVPAWAEVQEGSRLFRDDQLKDMGDLCRRCRRTCQAAAIAGKTAEAPSGERWLGAPLCGRKFVEGVAAGDNERV